MSRRPEMGDELSDELLPLIEPVARHLGANRGAWEDVPEDEREATAEQARELLRAIGESGYEITPLAADLGEEAEDSAEMLPSEEGLDLAEVARLWRAMSGAQRARAYRAFGERLLGLGAPLMAYDVVAEGLEREPNDLRLRQLLGLALARSGATERANRLLRELRDEGHDDEETLGMLARTHKDLWQYATDEAEGANQLRRAHEGYERAYEVTGGYWTGINAATMALAGGMTERARELAERVRRQCEAELEEATGEDRYWPLATLGEAALILGKEDEACRWYAEAAEVGAGQLGHLSTTRRNARLILGHAGCEEQMIAECLPVPNVLVFAGHMIDRPKRAAPRLPPELVDAVYEQIVERLRSLNCGVSFGSAACGADILFSEAMLEIGGEVNVVLPYESEQFVPDSVAMAGEEWGERFERVLEQAASVVVASCSRPTSGSMLYYYADLLIYGLGQMRARELRTELVPMAVWDERPGDGPGGTESVVERWRDLGHEVAILNPHRLLRKRCLRPAAENALSNGMTSLPGSSADSHQIMGIVFADLVNFHHLTEWQIEAFAEEFMGDVASLLDGSGHDPKASNTWGDEVFVVFATVEEAGRFALELDRFVRETDWEAHGLPANLTLRTGLHAGPVHLREGPITRTLDVFGTHVTLAARLVTVTPPGEIYASHAFAALAAAEGVSDFACDYVGTQELPKEGGACPTYHLRAVRQ